MKIILVKHYDIEALVRSITAYISDDTASFMTTRTITTRVLQQLLGITELDYEFMSGIEDVILGDVSNSELIDILYEIEIDFKKVLQVKVLPTKVIVMGF